MDLGFFGPGALVALWVGIFAWILGFYVGSMMSECMMVYLYGDGEALREATVTVRPIYYFFMLGLACVIGGLVIVCGNAPLPIFHVKAEIAAPLFFILGALYICDVRTRQLPEFFSIPLIVLGLWYASQQSDMVLEDAVAGGCSIVVARYFWGLVWNIVITILNKPIARLEYMTIGNGDFFLWTGCSIWIGFNLLGYFLLAGCVTMLPIAVLYYTKPKYVWASRRQFLLPNSMRVKNQENRDSVDDPRHFPFGTVIILSFLLTLAYKTSYSL